MAIPTSEETQTASSGLEWLLGGGGAFGTGAISGLDNSSLT